MAGGGGTPGGELPRWKVCLTFDVDLHDWTRDEPLPGEMQEGVGPLVERLEGSVPGGVTWFVRCDADLRRRYGSAEHALRGTEELLGSRAGRDELGWHPHVVAPEDGAEVQVTDDARLVAELREFAPVARDRGVRAARMGWGYHSNATMRLLADEGFEVDSSAIPRPTYAWETTAKDWSTTPAAPFRPSRDDYRVPGPEPLEIVEVPMSVARVPAPYDDGPVDRYLDLAYEPEVFGAAAARWFRGRDWLVTVAHPHEFTERSAEHPLMAASLDALDENLRTLARLAGRAGAALAFVTLSEFVDTLAL